jgi:hypothetical protein
MCTLYIDSTLSPQTLVPSPQPCLHPPIMDLMTPHPLPLPLEIECEVYHNRLTSLYIYWKQPLTNESSLHIKSISHFIENNERARFPHILGLYIDIPTLETHKLSVCKGFEGSGETFESSGCVEWYGPCRHGRRAEAVANVVRDLLGKYSFIFVISRI